MVEMVYWLDYLPKYKRKNDMGRMIIAESFALGCKWCIYSKFVNGPFFIPGIFYNFPIFF